MEQKFSNGENISDQRRRANHIPKVSVFSGIYVMFFGDMCIFFFNIKLFILCLCSENGEFIIYPDEPAVIEPTTAAQPAMIESVAETVVELVVEPIINLTENSENEETRDSKSIDSAEFPEQIHEIQSTDPLTGSGSMEELTSNESSGLSKRLNEVQLKNPCSSNEEG